MPHLQQTEGIYPSQKDHDDDTPSHDTQKKLLNFFPATKTAKMHSSISNKKFFSLLQKISNFRILNIILVHFP